ncbi:anti-sigma factor [Sodalinema gerasimenkoae]|uniref:anti-sigma factor n=1 Tax=Sodalinema gerasimenkoae TaxID=2862348 RepID=UPI001357B08F|nr:anti-sigma factor [Sodalinema gerasimenkoae]
MVSPLPPDLPSDCEQLLISGYILGDLSTAEAALFEELLAQNPQLQEQVDQMQKTLEVVYTPAEVTPPENLRTKVLAAGAEALSHTSPTASTTSVKPRWNWDKLVAFLAILGLIGFGVINYRLYRALQFARMETPLPIEIPILEPVVYSLQGTEGADTARARLIVDPNRLEAEFTVENLAPLPEDQVYVLWTVVGEDAPFTTDDKGAILTQTFQVTEEGEFSSNIVVPEAHRHSGVVELVAITIENRDSPQAHVGTIIALSQ